MRLAFHACRTTLDYRLWIINWGDRLYGHRSSRADAARPPTSQNEVPPELAHLGTLNRGIQVGYARFREDLFPSLHLSKASAMRKGWALRRKNVILGGAMVFNPLSQTCWSIYRGLEAQMNPSLLTTFMESIV
jgi:hypothetical protein